MGWLAEDVMTRNVVCVYEDMDARELAKLFVDKRITGAPVTSGDGRLLGVVSMTDLVRHALGRGAELALESDFYRDARIQGRHFPKEFQIVDTNKGTAAEIMSSVIHSVKPTTSVEDVARLMRRQHVHRVIVERNRRVDGLISALDLIAVVFSAPVRRKRSTQKK